MIYVVGLGIIGAAFFIAVGIIVADAAGWRHE